MTPDETPNPRLTRAVMRQLGGINKDTRKTLEDVAQYGADAGFSGFTYYKDTCKFFCANRAEIIALAEETAEEFGQGMIEMIRGFRCLDGMSDTEIYKALYASFEDDDATQVQNAMAWFALETVARWMNPDL